MRVCRLLGILSSERTDFHFSLKLAPKSLAWLSGEHPHGWGVAVYDTLEGWRVQKRPVRASECEYFQRASSSINGELLLAHVRSRTVGESSLANTHPFQRGRWLFAHNGTISNLEFLRAHTSSARRRSLEGQTDSELFFSYLLTQLDAAGLTDLAPDARTDAALLAAMKQALAQPTFGACNFLLSDGEVLYAHRLGRTLFTLERHPPDAVRVHRESQETGAKIETPWTQRRHAVLIASEEMTDEPWQAVAEGALLRCDRRPSPSFRILGSSLPDSASDSVSQAAPDPANVPANRLPTRAA
jgi:glutamine amidotransferase